MGIGTSIFLIAIGAILRYAVNAQISGLEIATIGLILMIAGAVGLVISLLYMTLWPRGPRDPERGPRDRVGYRDPELY